MTAKTGLSWSEGLKLLNIQRVTKNYLNLARIEGLCLRLGQQLSYLAKPVTNKRKIHRNKPYNSQHVPITPH